MFRILILVRLLKGILDMRHLNQTVFPIVVLTAFSVKECRSACKQSQCEDVRRKPEESIKLSYFLAFLDGYTEVISISFSITQYLLVYSRTSFPKILVDGSLGKYCMTSVIDLFLQNNKDKHIFNENTTYSS